MRMMFAFVFINMFICLENPLLYDHSLSNWVCNMDINKTFAYLSEYINR